MKKMKYVAKLLLISSVELQISKHQRDDVKHLKDDGPLLGVADKKS